MNEKRQSGDFQRTPTVFSFKDCEDIAAITKPKEIREENALGEKVMLLAPNILSLKVLIQHPSGHIQSAVEMQERKLSTKHSS